jgi:glycosyltransferase involved in cell wall biosynthesis
MKPRIFLYGWPSHVGGADTKVQHLLPLLKELGHEVMCVVNAPSQMEQKEWCDYLDNLGITYGMKEDIPDDVQGEIGLSICNPYFHNQGFCQHAKDKGLKVIWSSEMMWHHEKELDNIAAGLVDKVLYVSELQKAKLAPNYPDTMPWSMTGNFISADKFPYFLRSKDPFSIGRLSRADSFKFPEDFPVFYDEITSEIPERVEYHVMGWSEDLDNKYSWFKYKGHQRYWFLYPENHISVNEFLRKIHVHAYPLGHNFVESWGRSTVEAMLTGAVPTSFTGHHITELVEDGVSGFILDDVYDWKKLMTELWRDPVRRQEIGKNAADHARDVHCNPEEHKRIWEKALEI